MKDAYSSTRTREPATHLSKRCTTPTAGSSSACGLTIRVVEADSGPIGGTARTSSWCSPTPARDAIVRARPAATPRTSRAGRERAAHAEERRGRRAAGAEEGRDARPAAIERLEVPRTSREDGEDAGLRDREGLRLAVADPRRPRRQRGQLDERAGRPAPGPRDRGRRSRGDGRPSGFARPGGTKLPAEHRRRRAVRGHGRLRHRRQRGRTPHSRLQLEPRAEARRGRRPSHAERRRSLSRAATGKLEIRRGIEVGHIFKLGTKYSEALGRDFTDDEASSAAAGHGLLRHRRRPHRGGGDRAEPRRATASSGRCALAPFEVLLVGRSTRDDGEVRRRARQISAQLLDAGHRGALSTTATSGRA